MGLRGLILGLRELILGLIRLILGLRGASGGGDVRTNGCTDGRMDGRLEIHPCPHQSFGAVAQKVSTLLIMN